MEQSPKIELMAITDYSDVYNLWLNTAGMGLNEIDDSYEGIEKFLIRNPETNFIVKIDNKVVGVILCGHDGRRGHIYHTAVDENYRNHGIGRLLVENVIKALNTIGITKVMLVAFKTNDIGNSFWEKIGFSERTDLIYRNKTIKEL
jgi:Acetyltransferases